MADTINCLIIDDEPIAREVLENHLSKINTFKIVHSCKNAMEAFEWINSERIDLIFLDINMPSISGLSFAKSINKQIKIIFTTAYREFAVDGFDLNAVDYLLKPISFDRLLEGVNKFMSGTVTYATQQVPKEAIQEKQDYIFVRLDRKMIRVNFPEIKYIESLGDYITIHLKDKKVITRETIKNIEAKLPKSSFMRTHRSFIVSILKIESFTNEYILIEGKMIPISRSYKNDVLGSLGD